MPASPPVASKVVLAGGTSAFAVGLSVGTGLLVARGELRESALLYKQEARMRYLNDCTGSTPDTTCSKYLGIEQDRAILRATAITGLVGAGLAAAATLIYTFAPRSQVTPSIGQGEGVTISF
jgi:hypothetical protein